MSTRISLDQTEIRFVVQPWDFATVREVGERMTRLARGATFIEALGVTIVLVSVPINRDRIAAVHEEAKRFGYRSKCGWTEVAAPNGITIVVPTLRNPDQHGNRTPLFDGTRRDAVRRKLSNQLGRVEVHQATGFWLNGHPIDAQETLRPGSIFLHGAIMQEAIEAWYFPEASLSADELLAIVQEHLADAPDSDQEAYYVSQHGCSGVVLRTTDIAGEVPVDAVEVA